MISYQVLEKNYSGNGHEVASLSSSLSSCRERRGVRLSLTHLTLLFFCAVMVGFSMKPSFFSKDMRLPAERVPKKQVTRHDPNPVVEDKKGNDTDLKLIWLMSFPNSGTSFTSNLVRHIGKMSTASNYGLEYRDLNGNSMPVYSNETGPFWIDTRFDPDFVRPTSGYVMAKTHCGGRCGRCPPQRWIETPESFLKQCLSGEQAGRNSTTPVSYGADKVKKAIHLIRNPLDNAVSRFHLHVKRSKQLGDADYTKDRSGFRSFCHDLGKALEKKEQESDLLDQDILKRISKVPCHADFLRYVQWHNLAFHVTTHEIKVPTYVLHYENYETRYEKTVNELVDFLEIEKKGEANEFIRGKTYHNYFTLEERQSIAWMMKKLATKATWQNIHHYFAK